MAINMKNPTSSKGKKKEQAQSLVELAISLMVMLMLLLGAIEISLALFQYITIRDAAQEGALYGSIKPDDVAGVKFHAISAANDVIVLDGSTITVEVPLDNCEGLTDVGGVATPNYITVKIVYLHNIAFPIVGPMIGTNTIPLTATATNTILQPSCATP
jgi:Flp pilus assembly protein TadG